MAEHKLFYTTSDLIRFFCVMLLHDIIEGESTRCFRPLMTPQQGAI